MPAPDDYARENPPDSGSPSETFVGVPDATDVADLTLFDALPLILREIDEQQGGNLLQRLLQRPQEIFERQQQKIWKLAYMMDFERIAPALVKHLLTIVGFGRGSGLPYTIASELTTQNQRKLIGVAVAYWKKRGRRGALADFVRAFTGVRPAIRDWFQTRNVLDELVIGELWSETDLITSYTATSDTVSGDPDGELAVSIRVPLPAAQEYWNEPFTWQQQVQQIPGGREPNPAELAESDDISTDFVLNMIELARPVSERYQVAFVTWLDTMLDGRLGHWRTFAGHSAQWVAGYHVDPPAQVQHPHLLIKPGTLEVVDALNTLDTRGVWANYVWTSIVKLASGSSEARLWFYARETSGVWYGYYVRLVPPSTVELHVVTSGSGDVTLDTTTWPILVDVWLSVRVDIDPDEDGINVILVLVDGDELFRFTGNDVWQAGSIGVECPTGTDDVAFGPSEVAHRPLLMVNLTP